VIKRNKNKIKMSRGDRIFNIVNISIMIFLSFCFLYPFWYTFCMSFMKTDEAVRSRFVLFVQDPTFESYKIVLTSGNIWNAYKNTIIRTVLGSVLSLIVTFMGAVALARRDLPGRNLFQTIMIITMFFSGGLIPTYLLVKDLGLLNTWWAWILPGMTSCWHVVLCRNFIQSLPDSFVESAVLDGANPIVITFKIIMPLSKAIMAVLLLQFAVGQWNSYFDAMIYNREPALEVLQQLLRRILIDQGSTNDAFRDNVLTESSYFTTPQTVKAATVMVATIPIMCVYPFLQKYFVKGIMVGGLKG